MSFFRFLSPEEVPAKHENFEIYQRTPNNIVKILGKPLTSNWKNADFYHKSG